MRTGKWMDKRHPIIIPCERG